MAGAYGLNVGMGLEDTRARRPHWRQAASGTQNRFSRRGTVSMPVFSLGGAEDVENQRVFEGLGPKYGEVRGKVNDLVGAERLVDPVRRTLMR